MTHQILIVDDDEVQRHMLSTLLRKTLQLQSCEAEHGRAALAALEADQERSIQLVILDLNMPVMDGLETLGIIQQKYPSTPVIMLTGSKDIEDAVKAMKLGATDFLVKPYQGERMIITVRNALKISMLSKEVSRLKSEQEGTFTFKNLIGHEGGLAPIVHMGRKAASSDIPVLISGETGTGKEVFVKAIHGESKRSGRPFIAVNCGAIPAQLVESILFGHEKGAFTGATEKAIGKFREADGGTIFLDEVGELPLDTQVKLLRVLQQREVEPVGAGKAVPVNVRIISATNRDLHHEVKARHFRQDLFFRLNVLHIDLPPLRERPQDIIALANHFIERFCVNEGALPKDISMRARQQLVAYDWPGNVRQLENIMNRAMVVSESDTLEVENLEGVIAPSTSPAYGKSIEDLTHYKNIKIISDEGTVKTINQIEKEVIQIALAYFDHNVTQAAKAIGMAKSTLYKKMKSYDIQ